LCVGGLARGHDVGAQAGALGGLAAGAVIVRVERARETLEDLFVRSVVDEHGRSVPGAARP
ncbi:MAG: hypothetical protein ACKOV8_01380, partial [Phycisphaerales bacterium]